ncbi:MAG: hypothetical protein WCX79_01210 [Candidatus Paceibacterota bacterium]|jgi:hypothetical protein
MIDPVTTVDKESTNELLYLFSKDVDEEGYVIDENNKRVLALDGKEIKSTDIGGIVTIGGLPTMVRIGHFDSKWDPVN